MGRRTSGEYAYFQRLSFAVSFCLVHADASMQLVVQADFFVGYIIVSRQLNAVHAEVSVHDTWLIYVFAINLRQGDECTPIMWPVLDLGDIFNANLFGHYGFESWIFEGQGLEGGKGSRSILEGVLQRFHRIVFKIDEFPDLFQTVPENEPAAVQCAEYIGCSSEAGAFDVLKQQGRTTSLVYPKMDGGHLQLGIHFFLDPDELPILFQVQ